jgi:DNA adenine methylase
VAGEYSVLHTGTALSVAWTRLLDFAGPSGIVAAVEGLAAVRALEPDPLPGRDAAYRPGSAVLSPLRFPGAKRRLVGYVADVLASNHLSPELFVEPFAGGASVALQLLSDGVVGSVGLVDRDPLIASFWKVALFDTAWLLDQVDAVPLDLATWRSHKGGAPSSDRARALTCLYLNRTSFSGILASQAGPIGGTRRPFDADYFGCRFPRATLRRRLELVRDLGDRVRFVWNLDWHQALGRVRALQKADRLPQSVFYYLDPPFFAKADRLYRHYFSDRDHIRLRDTLVGMPADTEPWLLSYDSLPDVQSLYGESSRLVSIQRFYTTSRLIAHQPMFAEAVVTNLDVCPKPRVVVRR